MTGQHFGKKNKSRPVTQNIGQKEFQMDKIIKCENKMLGNPDEEFNMYQIWGI